jgi:hypothetical protein
VRIHADYAGPIDGCYYLVIVDSHSKWPEVISTRTISSKATISIFRQIFARYGPPEILVTDNGTQFTSTEFAIFCATFGVTHLRSPVYHPQSNGQAERFVDTIKRGLQKFRGEEADVALQELLYTYRYTPGSAVPENKSPAEIFLGRKIRNVFDLLNPKQSNEKLRDHHMEEQFNKRHGARHREFHPGDSVWILRKPGTPLEPGIVTRRRGHVMYDVNVAGEICRRHTKQLTSRPPSNSASVSTPLTPRTTRYPVRNKFPPVRFA